MAKEKRLIYFEDAIALLEKDVADSKDALKTAYYGDKNEIRAEMNGVRAAIHILKHHASHGGTVDAVEVVHGRWDEPSKHGLDKKYNKLGVMCSVCENWNDWPRRYCPNCGAKMDGGLNDE